MARRAREVSPTGVYHICLRGVNKQRIFEYPEDYRYFKKVLHKVMYMDKEGHELETPAFSIHAYCLMDNHIHLLLGVQTLPLGDIIKRVAGAYAQYFNLHYSRVGHLFQDRFRSEVCCDADYFYTLLTYIHNNPVKAGVCQSPDQYAHSSYHELTTRDTEEHLCDLHPNIAYVSESSIREWVLRINEESHHDGGDPYAEVRAYIAHQYYDLKHMTDAELPSEQKSLLQKFTHWGQSLLCNLSQAKKANVSADTLNELIVEAILGLSGAQSISDFQRLDKRTMRGVLAQIRDAGISIKRLSRISGISEGIIRGCKNPKNLVQE